MSLRSRTRCPGRTRSDSRSDSKLARLAVSHFGIRRPCPPSLTECVLCFSADQTDRDRLTVWAADSMTGSLGHVSMAPVQEVNVLSAIPTMSFSGFLCRFYGSWASPCISSNDTCRSMSLHGSVPTGFAGASRTMARISACARPPGLLQHAWPGRV